VKRAAVPPAFEAASLGRHSLDKVFSGDLEATSLGEMISAGDRYRARPVRRDGTRDRHAARPSGASCSSTAPPWIGERPT
jgi:hypothetical protein